MHLPWVSEGGCCRVDDDFGVSACDLLLVTRTMLYNRTSGRSWHLLNYVRPSSLTASRLAHLVAVSISKRGVHQVFLAWHRRGDAGCGRRLTAPSPAECIPIPQTARIAYS